MNDDLRQLTAAARLIGKTRPESRGGFGNEIAVSHLKKAGFESRTVAARRDAHQGRTIVRINDARLIGEFFGALWGAAACGPFNGRFLI